MGHRENKAQFSYSISVQALVKLSRIKKFLLIAEETNGNTFPKIFLNLQKSLFIGFKLN